MDGNQRTTRGPRNISRAKLILALLCGTFSAALATSAELPPEQAEALAAIEQALTRNLKAGERMRQTSQTEGFYTVGHGSQAILRGQVEAIEGEQVSTSVAEGAVIGLCLTIEQDLGCGCCFEPVATDIGDDVMIHVASLADLRDLRLHGSRVTGEGLRLLIGLKNLRRLVVPGPELSDDDLDIIAQLESLEELHIAGTKVTDEGLRKLAALKNLRVLDFSHTAATGEGLCAFAEHGQLQIATGGPRTRRALEAYTQIKSLEYLTVQLDPEVERDVTSDILITQMPNLISLCVYSETGAPLTASELPSLELIAVRGARLLSLSEAPQVTRVEISGNLNQQALSIITSLPSVNWLRVWMHAESQPAGLSLIDDLEGLETLHLNMAEMDVDGAAHLELPAKLQSLTLEAANADPAKLSHVLNGCRELRSIRLSKLNGTNGQALQLDDLYKLKTLELSEVDFEVVELRNLPQMTLLSNHQCHIGLLHLRNTGSLPLRTILKLSSEGKAEGIRQVHIEDYRGNRMRLDSTPPSFE